MAGFDPSTEARGRPGDRGAADGHDDPRHELLAGQRGGGRTARQRHRPPRRHPEPPQRAVDPGDDLRDHKLAGGQADHRQLLPQHGRHVPRYYVHNPVKVDGKDGRELLSGIDANTYRDNGFYAQDTWTVDRLTFNLGLRFEMMHGGIPVRRRRPAKTEPELVDSLYPCQPSVTTVAPGST